MIRHLAPPPFIVGANFRLEGSFLTNEPFADGGNPIVNLLAKDDMRGSSAEGALPLAGAETNVSLPRVFLFRNIPLEKIRGGLFVAFHLSDPSIR
jgi:hypothetical protein